MPDPAATIPDASPKPGTAGATAGECSTMRTGQFDRVRNLKVNIIVQLASRRIPVSTILHWGRGTIVEFGKSVDCDIDLLVANQPLAQGEAVKVGERFGLRITRVRN